MKEIIITSNKFHIEKNSVFINLLTIENDILNVLAVLVDGKVRMWVKRQNYTYCAFINIKLFKFEMSV